LDSQWNGKLEKIDDNRWIIPKQGAMRVPGLVYSSEKLLQDIKNDQSLTQVKNVAELKGIIGYSFGMPDIHWGYGFPIGGVAAMDTESGVISPGGVGYDINCGVRLIATNLQVKEVRNIIEKIVDGIFYAVPSGVGSKGSIVLSEKEMEKVMVKGARWATEKGFGAKDDLEFCEENGALSDADPEKVSRRAKERGFKQLGTLGAGNHFIEIQAVEEIFDNEAAEVFGIEKDLIVIMVHTGSRGFGYQICDDYLEVMQRAIQKYNIEIPDRQLACAPINSQEGNDYFRGMCAGANYAWANRQCITHSIRQVFERLFSKSSESLGLKLIYDVSHNIAKFEEHDIKGKKTRVCVHRKGATRAFGPGHSSLPDRYKKIGQPVIIPGDMGRNSYLLTGTELAMKETFGTVCHGAGRLMSRHEAIRKAGSRSIIKELEKKGIIVRSENEKTLLEEMSDAYKNVNEVVDVVCNAGLSKKIAKLRPLGVIKG